MSHEITTQLVDGKQVAFAAFEVPAWHGLGTVFDRPMTALESLAAANMANWNVRKVPVWADIRNDEFYSGTGSAALAVPSQYATVFNNPVTKRIQPIAIVGERWEGPQNEDMAEFGQSIIEEAGLPNVNSIGSLRNFTQTFMSIKLPQKMVLEGNDGQDVTEYYLTLFNSFDGRSTFFGIVSTVRVVCMNTARAAIANAKSKFSVHHTSGWKAGVEDARNALKLSVNYSAAFEAIVRDQLFSVPMTPVEMKNFAEDLVDLKAAKAGSPAVAKRQAVADHLTGLFISSPTIAGTPIAGTRFGAYNAVTEYVDHKSTVRGTADLGEAEVAAVRYQRNLLNLASDNDPSLKTNAWKLLVSAS